jgi:chromate transporter
MERDPPEACYARRRVPLSDAFGFWLRLGLTGFGGPAGQMAKIHAELVERRRWMSQARFLNAFNFSRLRPPPSPRSLNP